MDAKQFETLSKKLDTIVLLLSMDKLSGMSKKESILLLKKMGLDNSMIAMMVGVTPHGVAVVTSSEGKRTKASKGKVDNTDRELGGNTDE